MRATGLSVACCAWLARGSPFNRYSSFGKWTLASKSAEHVDENTWMAWFALNHRELERNARLTEFAQRDLNVEPVLPYDDASFDFVCNVVSVDYLCRPQEIFAEMHRVLRPGGIIVNAPTGSWPTLAEDCEAAGVRGTGYRVSPNGATLAVISRLLDSGDVRVAVEQVFDLAEAPAAHRQIESGHTRGKIVLHVAEN